MNRLWSKQSRVLLRRYTIYSVCITEISSLILLSRTSTAGLWTGNTALALQQIHWHLQKTFSCKLFISSQHVCRQTISPRQSAFYQTAVDDTSPARGDSHLRCLNSSVSIHTTSQESPSLECVFTCMFVLCQAITEGVGLATVTNTSQPLKSPRPRHLQCLLKTLRKNTTQKHPVNFQNWKKNNEKGQRVITGQAALCESELVSSSSETERQRSLTKLIFLLGVCGVAEAAVILCSTIITATENLLAAQELPHHSGQCVCSGVK